MKQKQYCQRKEPCPTCPYAKRTPAGVWHREEYEKLVAYDGDTAYQNMAVFMCHYTKLGIVAKDTICQGWLDCHDAYDLAAIRVARAKGQIPDDFNYEPSGVEVYESGKAAMRAGKAGIEDPNRKASRAIDQLTILRTKGKK